MAAPIHDEPRTAQTKPEVYGESGLGVLDRLGVALRTRAVRAHAKAHRPSAALDIGCGYEAGLLTMLAPHAGTLTGIDLRVGPQAVALPRSTWIEEPVHNALAGLPDEHFDLVTMLSVLEHLDDTPGVLAACHRVLRPGGTLFVHVPTWRGKRVLEWLAFRRGIATESIDDHRMYFAVADLWPSLIAGGFRPQHTRLRYHTGGCSLLATARRTS